MSILYGIIPSDNAASETFSCISCRLGTVIIRIFVNDYRLPDYVGNTEFAGKEGHPGNTVVGEEYRKISCMEDSIYYVRDFKAPEH